MLIKISNECNVNALSHEDHAIYFFCGHLHKTKASHSETVCRGPNRRPARYFECKEVTAINRWIKQINLFSFQLYLLEMLFSLPSLRDLPLNYSNSRWQVLKNVRTKQNKLRSCTGTEIMWTKWRRSEMLENYFGIPLNRNYFFLNSCFAIFDLQIFCCKAKWNFKIIYRVIFKRECGMKILILKH